MHEFEPAELKEVTNYLFTRREAILNNWRNACEQDKSLTKISTMSREEFNNLLPIVLDILEQRLLSQPEDEDLTYVSEGHALHRWQKALSLMDSVRELNHLTQVFHHELETFDELFPETNKSLLLHVYGKIVSLMQETATGSLTKYDELQRLKAAARVQTLEQALDRMNSLVQNRGDVLRKSSHDLRSSVGIVSSAAWLLQLDSLTDDDRKNYLDMLNRNLDNVQSMLNDLMDLSRLESGRETLQLEQADASQVLRDLVTGAQGIAQQHHVVLRADGPETLPVQTDLVKLQRIIQNILMNAIKYTEASDEKKALVSISWSAEGNFHWIFSIQDSGPGMPDNIAGVFADQLRPTVEETSVQSPHEAEPVAVTPENLPEIPSPEELEVLAKHSSPGEGVGLQIVKHLCEMLDANLDIESQKGRGTLFRVKLPIDYDAQGIAL
ncbi:sensor histidine kinase [Dyadobacter sandarakinus]|uniref:histidine kinase n=1 Tax=Dyadobacter sandarakinus TaxID=2747268 RepID=A0ABX7I4X4_9BACT|nr:HAMP domain-containing sensor histidine kinase [Dyadobacter sandarakinus]QRR00081.1 HAMP domain-containing histidine kinase [Dyadobacter sandarakinus]